tara:strand:+ start:164977 stop:165096 length:120 start_codon:yes stop_codon:yes gene_type:complete
MKTVIPKPTKKGNKFFYFDEKKLMGGVSTGSKKTLNQHA